MPPAPPKHKPTHTHVHSAHTHLPTCRRCTSEVESLNHSVMAAAELLLQYAETMRRNMQNLAGALGSVAEEVQAEGAGLITAQ